MRRIHQAIAVAVATVALAAAGCTSQTGAGTPPARSVRGREEQRVPPTPSPRTSEAAGTRPSGPVYQSWAHEAMSDTLVICNANGKATPDVADTFEVTDRQHHVQGAR